jgi:transposase
MEKRHYKQGMERHQEMLLPMRVEDYIAEDNPIRAVDVYVDSLDLAGLGFGNPEGGVSAGLQPNYKTIADFRKDNLAAFKAVNKDIVLLCQEMGLFGGELVALDSSHFRGNVGKKHIFTEKRLFWSAVGIRFTIYFN